MCFSPTASNSQRRYDIDWLRTLAMGLLIIYHVAISFQPWAQMLLFIRNDQSLEGLWIVMSMINVWRIPIVFMISGMGVRFAMERRNWKQLLKDRTIRILIPFVFGFIVICPVSVFVFLKYYDEPPLYIANAGHLWFLANIFLYVLLLLPFLTYLKNNPDVFVLRFLSKRFRRPAGLYLMALPLMLEAWLVKPDAFNATAQTLHGFCLGMVCYLTGFILVSLKDVFWTAVQGVRRSALAIAFLLYLVRVTFFHLDATNSIVTAFECMCWLLAILGHGSLYLNKPSKRLAYLSTAVYPVYIIHFPIQYCLSFYLMPLPLPAILKFFALLGGTFGTSLLIYEYVIRRLKWIRPLFGMKLSHG